MKKTLIVIAALLAFTATAVAAHNDFGVPKSQFNGIKNAVRSDGSLKPNSVGEYQLKNEIIGCEKLAKYLRPRVCGRLGLGAPGAKGADGANGAAGANGLAGALGETGSQGDTGATGATGPRGYHGRNGHDGKNGEDGKDGKDGSLLEGYSLSPACEVGNSIHPGSCADNDAAEQGVDVFVLLKNT